MRDLKINTGRCHSLNGIKREYVIGEITSREQTMDLTVSKRGFGMVVFIHLIHHREEVFVETHTTRFKTMGLLAYSNNKHASNSSGDGERAVSVKDDSIG